MMTSTTHTEAAEIRDRFVALAVHLPCHHEPGWSWAVADYRAYHRAEVDGTPTLHMAHSLGDDTMHVYFVGVHDLQQGVR